MVGQGRIKIEQKNKNETKTREVIKKAPKKEEGQGRIKIVQGQIKRKEETIKMELKETMMTKKEVRKEKRKEEKKEETQIEIMAETRTKRTKRTKRTRKNKNRAKKTKTKQKQGR